MNTKRIRHAALLLALAVILLIGSTTTAQAKKTPPRNGKYVDAAGNIYIYRHGKPRTGWFTYKGRRYYGHKSKSRMYPVGAVARNTFREKNGKLYYFGDDGGKQTHDSRYITINKKGTSVHYIYAPGIIRRYRYNVNHKRYQYLNDAGRWEDVGMQCWPQGMIDWQW